MADDKQWKPREMHPLLKHVVEDTCTDPDCEVHNIEVAAQEEVVKDTDIAFWLAGYQRAMKVAEEGDDRNALANHFDEILGDLWR